MKKVLSLILLFFLFITACSPAENEAGSSLMYFINKNGNGLDTIQIEKLDSDPEKAAQKLTEYFMDESIIPEGMSTVLSNSITIDSARVRRSTVIIDLKGDYGSISNTKKLLLRAGLTKAYGQIDGIKLIDITIQKQPLLDSDGNEFGPMSADAFVAPKGDTLNDYKSTVMELYFLDANGNIAKEKRNVYYRSSVPLEQVVMQELIKGPYIEGNVSAFPPEIEFNNVMIQEKIGYIDFSESIYSLMEGYNARKAFQTISRSFQAVCGVDEVQFSVNGDSMVRVNGVSLERPF
jgi:germination protein M